MKESAFRDFVLDQLRVVNEFTCKKINEGYGLYWGKNFFGIISDGKLYFRTNDKTAKTYSEAGMHPFPSNKASLKSYYQVPGYILDSSEDLTEWVHAAMSS